MNATTVPPTQQQRLTERQRPDSPVVMYQRWEQLLFLHWQWDADAVQATLPAGLRVDTYKGSAFLGIVPLFMRNVRPRLMPAVPMLSDFLELNVRTYVHDASGRPGLYFYSLDCDQPVAVTAAKTLLNLRYEHSDMKASVDPEGWVDFEAHRKGQVLTDKYRYKGFGPAGEAFPETLEFFLLERYRLFAASSAGDHLNSIRVCHPPYLFRQAQVTQWSDAVLRFAHFDTGGRAPDHICYAEPQEVEVFAPEKVQ